MQKILILGAGKMGFWLARDLKKEGHKVALLDKRNVGNSYGEKFQILSSIDQVKGFNPQMVINAVSLNAVRDAFQEIVPFLNNEVLLADVASVKNSVKKFYNESDHPFVSVHPMFGPTFGNLKHLHGQQSFIIDESDEEGKQFFAEFFIRRNIQIHYCTFEQHDETMASSLGLPYISAVLFTAGMHKQTVPGTSFRKQLELTEGILSEDPALLSEVLLNIHTRNQVSFLKNYLARLEEILNEEDEKPLDQLFNFLKNKISSEKIKAKYT